ncbi:MAG: T9SS type A sorting domain-containing protein, partial [Ferruginibacter sp.]
TATGIVTHLYKYILQGVNKLQGFKFTGTTLSQGRTAQNSSQSPYLQPTVAKAHFTSILTAGDVVGNYKMAGIPDGLGAFDNGNGTFTVLMNHELGNTVGAVRAHGSKGAFISKWVINKSDLTVMSGADLIQKVNIWDPLISAYATYSAANPAPVSTFSRFCSADLPEATAFYNPSSGLGTKERIFLNGEEAGVEGRAFAHIVTGPNAGTSYELPALGKFSWENSVANPAGGNKTIVAGMDDATPGQVYFYVGNKKNTGTEIEKAGLTNGKLYGVRVGDYPFETSLNIPAPGWPFRLADLGDATNETGASLQIKSVNARVTQFLRPEDGAWDPSHPQDFYFNTTNGFGSPSRLWKLHFSNLNNLAQGGTITAVLDGTEGQQMLDNMAIDNTGHIMLQEDVGGNTHIGKIWQYTIATDQLKQVAQHDSTRFFTGGAKFLTIDEESSGIIDVEKILGPGMFLTVDQAHYPIAGEVVEGGQLLAFYNPDTDKNPDNGNVLVCHDGRTLLLNEKEALTHLSHGDYLGACNVTISHRAIEITKDERAILYPNPSSSKATISFKLKQDEDITVNVFDLQGKKVMTVSQPKRKVGNQLIALNTADLSNGMYMVQVVAGTETINMKMVVTH